MSDLKIKKQAERHIRYGDAFVTQDKLNEALGEYQKAIDLDPKCFEAYKCIGSLFQKVNQLDKAEQAYREAIQINPKYHQAINILGSVYWAQGKRREAVKMYERAIQIDPHQKNAYNNLGAVLQELDDLEGAIVAYKKAIELDPKYAGAFYNLGYALKRMGDFDGADDAYFEAIKLDANFAEPVSLLYMELLFKCDWERAKKLSSKLDVLTQKALRGVGNMWELPYVSIFRSDDEKRSLQVAKYWADKASREVASLRPNFKFSRKKKDKLTIGYLSYNFRNHPVGQQIADLFSIHDKSKFKIIAYSYGPDDGSWVREKMEKGADEWVEIGDMNHVEAAEKIYEDGVDILVDLMGYTKNCRMGIPALRPAPIQVSWLGYPGTSGSGYIDYMIVDEVIAPKGSEGSFSESLVRMPDCYSIASQPKFSKNKFTRNDFGLQEDKVVLCSFNSPTKIGPEIFEVWMNILKKSDNSVLWLWGRNKYVSQNLWKEAIKRGVDKNRLIFGESLPTEDHLARVALADLALDAQMISGGATTSQALWMGVPVITVSGSHYLSRMSASMVGAAGLSELVLADLGEYQDKVVELANSREKLKGIREKLAQSIKTAPLFDTKLFVENLEKAYVKMWEEYLNGKR